MSDEAEVGYSGNDDPEFGITYDLARHAGFAKGARILAACAAENGADVPEVNDAESGGPVEFMDFITASVGNDMLAHVARVWLPGAFEATDWGGEEPTKRGGASKKAKRKLEKAGWVLKRGCWQFYLSSEPDPYK